VNPSTARDPWRPELPPWFSRRWHLSVLLPTTGKSRERALAADLPALSPAVTHPVADASSCCVSDLDSPGRRHIFLLHGAIASCLVSARRPLRWFRPASHCPWLDRPRQEPSWPRSEGHRRATELTTWEAAQPEKEPWGPDSLAGARLPSTAGSRAAACSTPLSRACTALVWEPLLLLFAYVDRSGDTLLSPSRNAHLQSQSDVGNLSGGPASMAPAAVRERSVMTQAEAAMVRITSTFQSLTF
jgi:hypothetical protein